MLIRPLTAILGSAVLLLASQVGAQEAPAKRFEVRQTGVSRPQAVGLSLIFPGLGQLATGHKLKGTALMAAEMGCLVIWLTSHEDFNTQKVQFELEKERYQALRDAGTFAQAEASWQRLADKKDDLDQSHLLRRVFGVLSLATYSYNVLDVLFYSGAEPVADKAVNLVPIAAGNAPGMGLVARF